ncbi:hybrid sensor histidine kinase/response regulator [Trichothermofontia sichuanensis B231]|uniref:hybrid sensor histidine kinase/response regulator n=1 Tax=Trichothermofontia sichuanensis TaxID=3045816 RepID=UPI0022483392|nr:hybrid sensor histidine kinase/response regulator [Trichothermofontia sichuanensis]UZQ56071.1 hybrid sensor histidine kinase/response regulator [Trichothermofontia sichuanensis B231]
MFTPSILIVDDEPTNFEVIEALLANQSYDLHYSASGLEAITSLATFAPDVILLDVMMPDMDGIEVCRQIKAMSQWQAVPIIMVTALNSKEDLARCLEAGADDFISKPVNGLELRARVHSMLRIKCQYDRIQSFAKLQRNTITLLQENLQELRGNLASTLPHELNTPLTSILFALNLIKRSVDPQSDPKLYGLVEIAYQSSMRLEGLTQKFLRYLHLELVTIDLTDDAGVNGTNSLKLAADEDIITPSLEIVYLAQIIAEQYQRSADLICEIEAVDLAVNPQYLRWIVSELVDNAFKFSPDHTPVILRSERHHQRLHLWLNNQGRGMTEEQIAKVGAFMQFERQTYEQQGTGLGLRIAQKALELYASRLHLTSTYQQGLTVDWDLPIVQSL